MRVIYSIATKIGAGGLGVDSFHAIRAIYRKGYLKKVICYGNKQKEIPSRYIKSINCHPVKIFSNLPARYYYPVKRKALDRTTKSFLKKGADIMHCWSSSSLSSLMYCQEHGIISFMENPGPHLNFAKEIVISEYEELGIKYKKEPEFFKNFFGQDEAYHLAEYENANYIILESEFTYNTFIKHGIAKKKLCFLPNGVDAMRFHPPESSEKRIFRVLFVGALCIRKGIRYLLEAWTKLQLKNAELLLVGSIRDEIRPILQNYLNRNNNIKIIGQVKDPLSMYHSASLFVFPSLSEGSAKVTYEAMACGLPLIVTPNAGSVAIDGQHGFIIPAKKRKPLMEKLLYMYENPAHRVEMGRAARKYIKAFSWERRCHDLLVLYKNAHQKALSNS